MRRIFKRAVVGGLSAAMVLSSISTFPVNAAGIDKPAGFTTAYDQYGNVKVAEDPSTGYQQLCDANGNPIQLKGMSTFGLQWGDGNWVLNDEAFDALDSAKQAAIEELEAAGATGNSQSQRSSNEN